MSKYEVWATIKVPVIVEADTEYEAKCEVFSMPVGKLIDTVTDWSEDVGILSATKLE